MFNINDNKRYKLQFDELPNANFCLEGSWEIVDSTNDFSLLLESSQKAWIDVSISVKGDIDNHHSPVQLSALVLSEKRVNDWTVSGIEKQNVDLDPNQISLSDGNSQYEFSIEIPPRTFNSGLYYISPKIEARIGDTDLGIIGMGNKAALQVLDITY